MSIRLMSRVWDYGPNDSTQRFVLLTLADYANDDGYSINPALATIARRCALSRRSVIRAINALVDSGYITRTHRWKDEEPTSSEYTIVVSRLVDSQQSTGREETKMTTRRGDTLSPPSDTTSLRIVNMTLGNDMVSLGGDKYDTTPSDRMSPDPSFLSTNDPPLNRGGGTPTRAHYGQFDRTPGTNGKGYKLPAEPPVSPPAAQLMQKLTGRYPGANNIGYIAQRLGDKPDEAALADVVREWSARGYSMSNYAGMCDWYDERKDNPQWKPSRNGTGKATAQPAAILTQPIVNGLY